MAKYLTDIQKNTLCCGQKENTYRNRRAEDQSHRPMTQIRFPDGILNNKFYSKNKPNWTPSWVASIKVSPSDEKTYIMVNEIATLAWTANLATLELHPMQIRANHVKYADHFILDLDPPATADFNVVKKLAQNLKPFLASYGYHPFIKTSGSKGLHIYVPIIPQYDNETLVAMLKDLAKAYIKQDPSVTLKMSKEKRKACIDSHPLGRTGSTHHI